MRLYGCVPSGKRSTCARVKTTLHLQTQIDQGHVNRANVIITDVQGQTNIPPFCFVLTCSDKSPWRQTGSPFSLHEQLNMSRNWTVDCSIISRFLDGQDPRASSGPTADCKRAELSGSPSNEWRHNVIPATVILWSTPECFRPRNIGSLLTEPVTMTYGPDAPNCKGVLTGADNNNDFLGDFGKYGRGARGSSYSWGILAWSTFMTTVIGWSYQSRLTFKVLLPKVGLRISKSQMSRSRIIWSKVVYS